MNFTDCASHLLDDSSTCQRGRIGHLGEHDEKYRKIADRYRKFQAYRLNRLEDNLPDTFECGV